MKRSDAVADHQKVVPARPPADAGNRRKCPKPLTGPERSAQVADLSDQGVDIESGLTLRERAAVDHYLISLNKTKAYMAAGYSADDYTNARKRASELFTKPDVSEYLKLKMNERSERLRVSADRVLLESCVIAFSKVTDFRIDPDNGRIGVVPGVPHECIGAVKGYKAQRTVRTITRGRGNTETIVTWTGEIFLWDKCKSIEFIGKHLGLVSAELPPLEILLNRLPAHIAAILRQLLSGPPERYMKPSVPPGIGGDAGLPSTPDN